MKKLSFYEQETLISFNRKDKIAQVYTHEPRLIRRLQALSLKYPDTFRLTDTDFECGFTYEMPKGLISIRAPISKEQRAAMRERGLKIGRMLHIKTGVQLP
jgi:hypothetical protein